MTVFKQHEGMTLKGSTIEQRHKIYKMLFDLDLISEKLDSIDEELEYLSDLAFYNSFDGFLADYSKGIKIVNIPFDKFKERLLKFKSNK